MAAKTESISTGVLPPRAKEKLTCTGRSAGCELPETYVRPGQLPRLDTSHDLGGGGPDLSPRVKRDRGLPRSQRGSFSRPACVTNHEAGSGRPAARDSSDARLQPTPTDFTRRRSPRPKPRNRRASVQAEGLGVYQSRASDVLALVNDQPTGRSLKDCEQADLLAVLQTAKTSGNPTQGCAPLAPGRAARRLSA